MVLMGAQAAPLVSNAWKLTAALPELSERLSCVSQEMRFWFNGHLGGRSAEEYEKQDRIIVWEDSAETPHHSSFHVFDSGPGSPWKPN